MNKQFLFLVIELLILFVNSQICDKSIAGSCLQPNQKHRNFKKYIKEQLSTEIDQDFNDDEINQEIIEYFHKWSTVKLHPTIHYDTGMDFNTPHLGLKNDFQYCKKSDIFKLQHPESIYDNYFILSDFAPQELPREITKQFGVDVMPNIYMGMDPSKSNQRLYDISIKTSLLNSRISRFHHFHHFSKCMFCLFQTANHVPGKWALTGKDLVIDNLRKYQEKSFVNKEVCTDTIQFMPASYRLYDKQECQQFFEYLESEEYANTIKNYGIGFILKQGRDIHRGEGIELLLPQKLLQLKKQYQNGQKCGINKKTLQAQTYIANPMLYKGRKIEVRIYFFIASTDPLIIYSQNLAHLRMCGEDFDLFSLKKEVHVCNVAVANKKKDKDYVVDFSLDGLRDYLIEQGIIQNTNWVEEEIYPQIYKAIIHLVRLGQHDLLVDSRVNENFAVDFLLDSNSKIWFMENNPNPQIMKISNARVSRHQIMFGDLFEIQFNQLRSRFKRLQNLAKQLKNDIQLGTVKQRKYKKLFKIANQNKLEPEYEINYQNTYQKIYDDNLEGVDKFMGNLPEECLYQNDI